jgi:hypothetical protein
MCRRHRSWEQWATLCAALCLGWLALLLMALATAGTALVVTDLVLQMQSLPCTHTTQDGKGNNA